ncbi:hypothetical protein NIES2100_05220 [Calothrix sp. NIES-2100]|uniref:hypothetical protein n=1 Tax=Calothrix sp. NIES-2100 TaxID=1954172 RepID=UPI000B5E0A77|nr:hypothetical protein NIES2100_05220 [Calothrix sp. NIES-2100]
MEITKKDFDCFEKIRVSGKTNMYNLAGVTALSDGILNHDKIKEIIGNYDKYANIFKK